MFTLFMAGTSTRARKHPPARGHSFIIRDKRGLLGNDQEPDIAGDSYLRDVFKQLMGNVWG